MKIKVVGVINITPDSFSDGGETFSNLDDINNKYEALISEGADIVEFGADSSRPGSSCVGHVEEIKRLSFLNSALNFGVDTHLYETADFAVKNGAQFINDISGGADSRIFSILGTRQIVLMNSLGTPHDFKARKEYSLDLILDNLRSIIAKAEIDHKQIIIDPGMGGFLSSNPADSIDLLNNFDKVLELGFPVMLGISRKGFLRSLGADSIEELDQKSFDLTTVLLNKFSHYQNSLYLRVHNVKLYQELK